MTALCGGGPSGPQASASGTIDLHVSAVAAFLVPVVGDIAAAVLAPLIIAGADIVAPTFCATDPPADPGLTATILADAIALPPTLTTFDSITKVVDWFEHQYWFQICQCNTVTTPAAPTPSNPGPVNSNPGLPQGSYTPCWNATVNWFLAAYSGTGQFPAQDLSANGLPSGVPIGVNFVGAGIGHPPINAVPINPKIRNMTVSVTVNEAISDPSGQIVAGTSSWNADGSQFTGGTPTGPGVFFDPGDTSPKSNTVTQMGNTTTPRWWALTVQNKDLVGHTGTLTLSFQCPPGVTYGSCCSSTDPLLEGELQAILQYVQAIYAGLPGQLNSFAEGTVHSGLTGTGSFSIAPTSVAIKVAATFPGFIGVDVGTPDFHFDGGFITFATTEGSYTSTPLVFTSQVLTVPPLGFTVQYTLLNGVTATITELTPGP